MNIAIKDRLQEFPNDKDENIFKHRIQKVVRKGARIINIEQYKYKCFCFNGNLHSIKLEEEKFTNFLSSYDNKLSNILKKVFEKLYLEEYDFLEEFVLDEYEASEYTQESKRLKRIITKANNIDDNKLPQIHKFKPTKYKMKQDKRYEMLKIELTTEELDVLVNRIYEYTVKLASDNAVELTDDEKKSSDNSILNLQRYLKTQKRIFKSVA